MASLLDNVQGDILLDGLAKRVESFFFFKIEDAHVKEFCQSLKQVAGEIANSTHTKQERAKLAKWKNDHPGADSDTMPTVGANIAFSMNGLRKMQPALKSLQLNTGDFLFEQGMKAGAVTDLNDPIKSGNEPAWDAPFMQRLNLHGVVLVAGNSPENVKSQMDKIKSFWKFPGGNAFVSEVTTLKGKVRPGEFKGHEHFGFEDGISQPGVKGVDDNTTGGGTIRPGIAICGQDGARSTQPDWMKDGSFLAFRKLAQKVPEWNKFLVDASNVLGTWSGQLGARLIGRWPSGCPVQLSPENDSTTIAKDSNRVNNFVFDPNDHFKCPIGAHIRKTNPRSDIGGDQVTEPFRILRRGIPYGPEVNEDAAAERGLLFVCYQSSLASGFHFIQTQWANQPDFVTGGTGLDATIGQRNDLKTVDMPGLFPQDATRKQTFQGINQFVVPKGGEYFFSPSMTALKTTLADVKDVPPKAGL